jgi:hypothetical protein
MQYIILYILNIVIRCKQVCVILVLNDNMLNKKPFAISTQYLVHSRRKIFSFRSVFILLKILALRFHQHKKRALIFTLLVRNNVYLPNLWCLWPENFFIWTTSLYACILHEFCLALGRLAQRDSFLLQEERKLTWGSLDMSWTCSIVHSSCYDSCNESETTCLQNPASA